MFVNMICERMLTELLTLLISLLLPHVTTGTQCLSCNDLVSPIDCGKVITCGSHQQCFTEFYITVGGHQRYNLGCRDTLQCSQFDEQGPLLNQSQSDSILACTQCCNSTLCNSAGCGHQGYSTSRGPVCYNCHDQMSVGDCDTLTVCGRDEVCMIDLLPNDVSHELRYHTKCELTAVCEDQLSKWRTIQNQYHLNDNSCHVDCCTEDLCNSKCNNSKPAVTYCYSNPCVHGTCSESQSTYICTCVNGYTGRNCDIALTSKLPVVTPQTIETDYCASRPCMFGLCHNDTVNQTFICNCSIGYVGATCNHTVCDSHPCQNGGTCHVHRNHKHAPHYFSCRCDVHHDGRLCEIVKTISTSVATTTAATTPVLDPCSSRPCIHGSCLVENGKYVCHCHPDFQGSHCDVRRILTTTPISSAASTTSMPQSCDNTVCLNRGSCHVRKFDNTTFCRCLPKYSGEHCQVTRHCLNASDATSFSVNQGSVHFTFVPDKMIQSTAYKYCQTHCLGRLLRVDSDQKYNWVHHFLVSHHDIFRTDLWIDGHWNSLEHRWETEIHKHMNVSDVLWRTTDWVANKPCVNLENEFHHRYYLLESQRCDAFHHFICEYYL